MTTPVSGTTTAGTSTAASAPAPAAATLGRPFHALVASSGLANLGDGVVQMGVPLLAVTLTRSPAALSLVAAAPWLPWLVLGVAAGTLVDRVDRRHAQLAALAARAVVLGAGAWLAATGRLTLPVLAVLVLAYGVTEVLADLASAAMLPTLVPRALLPAANGRLVAVQQVANSFVGAPVAGALLTLGGGWLLGAPAALALLAVLLLARGVPGSHRAPAGAGPVRAREGLGVLLRHRVVRPVVLTAAVLNMASTGYFTLFVLWCVGPGSRLGLTPQLYSVLAAGLAVGAVAGSLLAPRLVARVGEVRLILGAWLVAYAALALPVLVPHVAAVAVTVLVVGTTSTAGNVLNQTMRQRLVPAHLLGRVSGASRTLATGAMPLGALAAGAAAELAGLAPALLGATAVAVTAVVVLATRLRQRVVDEEVSRAARAG
ncbi:MFS transporter [Cellulomonas telluris]|uniref:MFS transporter n=1 Tax=Cellulomonas telluris TaxID=2306636 RepID=UPI0010A77D1C|nr:MFS transporter [Cellulomonas telluris]